MIQFISGIPMKETHGVFYWPSGDMSAHFHITYAWKIGDVHHDFQRKLMHEPSEKDIQETEKLVVAHLATLS